MRSRHALLMVTLPLLAALASPTGVADTLLRVDASEAVAAPTTGYLHPGTTTSTDGHSIGVNNRYLLRDGQPWLPVMGEFHYTRVPSQYWDEELAKVKTSGVDIVSIYVIVRNGDEILLDGPNRRLELLVPDAEITSHLAEWNKNQGAAKYARGYYRLYTEHVTQADRGRDFDFLAGASGSTVERESH